MRTLLLTFALLTVMNTHAQETKPAFDGHTWQAPYTLSAPKGWGIERFPLPVAFAPSIPYTGMEDIRFTPGWGDAKSEEYWSYAFLWYLDGKIKLDGKTAATHLMAYYNGLLLANVPDISEDKKIPAAATFTKMKKSKGDKQAFTGLVQMVDYMQQKPIFLNVRVHVRYNATLNKTYIFHELSPQPFTHAVWQRLDQLWNEFRSE